MRYVCLLSREEINLGKILSREERKPDKSIFWAFPSSKKPFSLPHYRLCHLSERIRLCPSQHQLLIIPGSNSAMETASEFRCIAGLGWMASHKTIVVASHTHPLTTSQVPVRAIQLPYLFCHVSISSLVLHRVRYRPCGMGLGGIR
jgi:hypothetical protein